MRTAPVAIALFTMLLVSGLTAAKPLVNDSFAYGVVDQLRVTDSNYNPVEIVAWTHQIMMWYTKHPTEVEDSYVIVMEVRDNQDRTVSIAWQSGVATANVAITAGFSWMPPEPGSYQARGFVVSNMTNPQILSDISEWPIHAVDCERLLNVKSLHAIIAELCSRS